MKTMTILSLFLYSAAAFADMTLVKDCSGLDLTGNWNAPGTGRFQFSADSYSKVYKQGGRLYTKDITTIAKSSCFGEDEKNVTVKIQKMDFNEKECVVKQQVVSKTLNGEAQDISQYAQSAYKVIGIDRDAEGKLQAVKIAFCKDLECIEQSKVVTYTLSDPETGAILNLNSSIYQGLVMKSGKSGEASSSTISSSVKGGADYAI